MNPVDPACYARNADYESRPHQDGWLIVHHQGGAIWADDLVHAAWQATSQPRTLAQLYEALSPQFGISLLLLQTILRLLEAAYLVRSDRGADCQSAPQQTTIDETGKPGAPLVSVVVLHDDASEEDLKPCLASVAQQTHSPLETLLVGGRPPANPDVRHVPLEPGAGRVTAANRGIATAQGEYLFLLDGDVELAPCCLEEALVVLQGSPDIAAVAPKIRFAHLRRFIESIGASVESGGWVKGNCQGYLDLGQFDDMEDVFAARLEAVLLRRQAMEQVGRLDEGYGRYYADVDWCYRARLAGVRTVAAPQAVAYREPRIVPDASLPDPVLGRLLRNRLRFALKDLNWGSTFWLLYNYWQEDSENALLAARRDRAYRRALLYATVWLRFGLASPETLYRRGQVRRTKKQGITGRSIFDLTLIHPLHRMKGPYPVLSLTAIRAHYIHLWRPSGPVTWREVRDDLVF